MGITDAKTRCKHTGFGLYADPPEPVESTERSSGSGAGTLVAGLPETLAEIDGVLAGLTSSARDQVDALGHGELGPVLVALRQVQARCDALILATIGEVDARGTFTLDGALTSAAPSHPVAQGPRWASPSATNRPSRHSCLRPDFGWHVIIRATPAPIRP